jgi:hypothetical protein
MSSTNWVVWLHPSLFESLLFLVLVLLLWLGIPKLYWIRVGKLESPGSLLRGTVSVVLHLVWFWLYVCHIIGFVMLKNVPSIPSFFSALLSWKGVGFCQRLFLHYWEDHVVFVLASVYILYYIYGFTYVEPSLHPGNETNLVMVYDLFDELLNCLPVFC